MNHEIFQNLVNRLDEGVVIIDHKMEILFWNKWMSAHSRLTPEVVHGQNIFEIYPETRDTRFQLAIHEAIESSKAQFLSNLFHRSPVKLYPSISAFGDTNESLLQLDINIIPFPIEERKACIIQIRDVTFSARRESALESEISQRITTEKQLRESESRYRILADNSSDIIIKTDLTGKIDYISPICEPHLSFNDTQLLGINILELIHPDDRMQFMSELKTKHRPPTGTAIQHRLMNKDKAYQWYESIIKSVTSETYDNQSFVIITRNVTSRISEEEKRLQLQEQLNRAQRVQALGQLTGGIAHDFNNLLTSIIGYTDLCTGLHPPVDSIKLGKYLSEIKISSSRAKQMVIQLLEYSQGRNIQMQPLDITYVIDRALEMARSTLPSSVEISKYYEDNLPAVISNHIQLEQVLLNVCINAKDAMNERGKIDIYISNTNNSHEHCSSCHDQFNGAYVVLEISNTGPDISQENLEKVFQPFFTTKERAENSGLGLSVVHGIVHSQHGHIVLKNTSSGVVFRIYLPSASGRRTSDHVKTLPETRLYG